MTSAGFKNIMVEGNRVTFVNRGSVAGAVCSLVIIVLQLFFLPRQLFSELGLIQLFFLIAVFPDLFRMFIIQVLNLRNSTIFDGDARQITHTNTAGISQIHFVDAAAIAKVELSGDSAFYKATPKGKRFGRGWHLTAVLKKSSPEVSYMDSVVLPALNQTIIANGGGNAVPADWTGGDGTRRYCQSGEVYCRFFWRPYPVWMTMVILVLVLAPIQLPMLILLLLIGGAAYCFIGSGIVRLDAANGEMHIRSSLQERTVHVPFADFIGVYERNSLSMLQPKSVHIRYRHGGVVRECPLCYAYRPGVLEAVTEETEGIISAYRED